MRRKRRMKISAPRCGRKKTAIRKRSKRCQGRAIQTRRPRQLRQAATSPAVQKRNRYSIEKKASRSEEHTSELQSLMRISYAVFCLKKKTTNTTYDFDTDTQN